MAFDTPAAEDSYYDDDNGAPATHRFATTARRGPQASGAAFGGVADVMARTAGAGRRTARNGKPSGRFGTTAREVITARRVADVMARTSKGEQELAARPYVKPWNQVHIQPPSEGPVPADQQPRPRLDASDYERRLRFEELQRLRVEAMCRWK